MIRWILVFLAILNNPALTEKAINVLFVGNSLTYTNDLPSRVKVLAREEGVRLRVKTLAFPNYALEDHWMDGELQQLINSRQYHYVIVQQGPSSQPEGRAMLLEFGEKISQLCNENNSRLGFYMVWPSKNNYITFEGVIENYAAAAMYCNALLFPVGEAWKVHFDTTRNYDYYGPDNFHPSEKGTDVAAEIIAGILLKEIALHDPDE